MLKINMDHTTQVVFCKQNTNPATKSKKIKKKYCFQLSKPNKKIKKIATKNKGKNKKKIRQNPIAKSTSPRFILATKTKKKNKNILLKT